jgi:signal transduction histidine kinase
MDVSAVRRDLERTGSAHEPDVVLKKLDAMAKAIDETLETARRVAAQLRPAILDELGLTAAIEWQAREFEQRSSIFCNLVLPSDEPELDPERATAVFRILQEVLTNVTRHAKATEVSVELRVAEEAVTLEVRDNGVGIEQLELARVRGLGLLGMHERAIAAGLRLEVQSQPGQGTAVTVEIPLGGHA